MGDKLRSYELDWLLLRAEVVCSRPIKNNKKYKYLHVLQTVNIIKTYYILLLFIVYDTILLSSIVSSIILVCRLW